MVARSGDAVVDALAPAPPSGDRDRAVALIVKHGLSTDVDWLADATLRAGGLTFEQGALGFRTVMETDAAYLAPGRTKPTSRARTGTRLGPAVSLTRECRRRSATPAPTLR